MRHLVFLLPLLAACASAPLEERAWIEVRSANFAIVSNLPPDGLGALSEELELFHAVVRKLTNAKRFEPRVPTRIFAFARSWDFRPFAPGPSVNGFFRSGLRENVVALDASGARGSDPRRLFFHEYTHFLLHNQDQIAYPLWYDEGFAEFLGTLRLDGESVFIGAAPMFRRSSALWGGPLGIETVVRARSFAGWTNQQIGIFYLQAWQLVHYLTLGPGKRGELGARMGQYVRRLELGADEEVAFEQAFGMDFDALWKGLRDYNLLESIPAISVPLGVFAPETGYEIRAIAPAEIAVDLGFLALAAGRVDLAEDYFSRAVARDPLRSRAHAGLGAVRRRVARGDSARADFERAIALEPGSYENHLEIAEWLHEAASSRSDLALLAEAREHYRRAIELAPWIPEGHAMLGQTYALTEEDPTPGIASLERARSLLPGEVRTAHRVLVARRARRRGREAPRAARLPGWRAIRLNARPGAALSGGRAGGA